MGIIWILLCAMLLMISISINRDVANPVFISGAVWLGMYLILLFTNREVVSSDMYYGCFAIAFLFFFMGFYIVTPKYKEKKTEISIDYEWKPVFSRCIFALEYVMTIYCLLKGVAYFSEGVSLWNTLRVNKQYFMSGIDSIIFEMIPIVFFVAWGMFLANPNRKNRNDMLLSLPPLVVVMLFTNRGNWFFVLITAVFIYIYIRRVKVGKMIKYGIVGVCAILVIFIISSFDKFSNAYLWMGTTEKIRFFFEVYFANPPITFINWLHSDYTLQYGKYTFRFLYALIQPFFPDIEVVNLVLPFVKTNGLYGNVYTMLQWYTQDFGIWWAFFIQLMLGSFYGFIYKSVRSKSKSNMFNIILLSMFMYPIANQFFDEKIFSILSAWIQRAFWLFLFTRPCWCVKSTEIQETKHKIMRKRIRFVW